MKYVYCQLISLIQEEYSVYEIASELNLATEDLKDLVYSEELDPQDIFDREKLEEWAYNHGFIIETKVG